MTDKSTSVVNETEELVDC